MIRKTMFLLLASMLAITYCKAQVQSQVKDTSEVGVLYVVDPMTFNIQPGYVKRVIVSQYEYQQKPGTTPGADSVTYVKSKRPIAVSYYKVDLIKGKETWVLVKVVYDFDVNYKLK